MGLEEEGVVQHEGLVHDGGEGHHALPDVRGCASRGCQRRVAMDRDEGAVSTMQRGPAHLPQTLRHHSWEPLSQAHGTRSSKSPVEHGRSSRES